MKIQQLCAQCTREAVGTVKGSSILTVELRDDNLYDCTCSKGHKTLVIFQNEKFEILFESGAMALLDGYNREAVSSFAAALERFLEFYIKVILHKNEISREEFEKTWKSVTKQSERQLGAFLFLYLRENKKSVNFIHQDFTTFRNRVIHEGDIPTYEESLNYGEAVLAFIFKLSRELKENDWAMDVISEVLFKPISRAVESYPDSLPVISGGSTMIRMNSYGEGFGIKTLKELLEEFKENIKFYDGLELYEKRQ